MKKIKQTIGRRTHRLAAWLNRRTQHWNKTSKVIALALFMLVFGAFCLLTLIKSIL
ncbi:MAG: hypothetical protein ACTHMI_24235 [Mucilaginibacter sp.]